MDPNKTTSEKQVGEEDVAGPSCAPPPPAASNTRRRRARALTSSSSSSSSSCLSPGHHITQPPLANDQCFLQIGRSKILFPRCELKGYVENSDAEVPESPLDNIDTTSDIFQPYPPDGLLTLKEFKHDVDVHPCIIAPDPFASGDYLDDFPPARLFQLITTDELNMNTSEDEPSSGLNGRLRPRKSQVPSPQSTPKIKSEGKTAQDKKKTNNPSKALPNKEQDDLATKSDFSPTPQFLCPYCDRKFASRQTVSKHFRRIHNSTSKQDAFLGCLFCNHTEADNKIIRHMVDSHPNQYFACLNCHTRFLSTSELAEHKLNVCEKQKVSCRTKLRQKITRGTKKSKKSLNIARKDVFPNNVQDGHGFNGIVISCELKPSQDHDGADIEDNITTNLILPSSKSLGTSAGLEKNAVIVLDDIQWNKRIPPNFSFHNTDPDQILSRLGVVHRSPRTGESTRKDWFKTIDDATQKFERCFDTKFYSKVASNVQENLAKFLDGSFNFNPDPENTIKTRRTKNNVVINTAEGFPILLASEQYSRSAFDSYLPRAIAPKHKWKWDNLENDKIILNPDQIKRDSHTNNCIITLVSGLDIWTQLSMRRKYEDKFNNVAVEKKTEKRHILSQQLKEILESREIPTLSQVVSYASRPSISNNRAEFPAALGLVPAAPTFDLRPAVLSGEWVRPRCFMCCACGEQTTDSKGLSSHISTNHPYAHVQYYEIVDELLLNADILKHLYLPPSHVCNRTRPPRGFRECTKCNQSITLEDLHQHMLDCAGDTPAVRRRQGRSRPFGVRRRRPRMPDNTIRKKMRKDITSRQRRQKSHMRPRPRRTEVGDAETIRKMLADLPAKRHRVLVNPMNMTPRPRSKLNKPRSKLVLRKCSPEVNKKRRADIRSSLNTKVKSEKSDDSNKGTTSSLEEDDDNKPLKPRLKPMINKTKRQQESFKILNVVSTVKRKSIRVAKRKVVESANPAVDSLNGRGIQEASTDKPPQKLDMKRGSYNTRDHANRGASGSRDDQRPGCSGANRSAENDCAPTQNVPLKHSIARLTANSETHDKSVQFHHLFLVQQECNNTNQHVPSGQQLTLFENEAVVTKLDKPPLNYCQKGFIDTHKNKLNKPRKGLNDCIAMLKNKLVDPMPVYTTGHVSVQCGSDEPIDADLRIIIPTNIQKDFTINHNLQPEQPLGKNQQTQQSPDMLGEKVLHKQHEEHSELLPPSKLSRDETVSSKKCGKNVSHKECEEKIEILTSSKLLPPSKSPRDETVSSKDCGQNDSHKECEEKIEILTSSKSLQGKTVISQDCDFPNDKDNPKSSATSTNTCKCTETYLSSGRLSYDPIHKAVDTGNVLCKLRSIDTKIASNAPKNIQSAVSGLKSAIQKPFDVFPTNIEKLKSSNAYPETVNMQYRVDMRAASVIPSKSLEMFTENRMIEIPTNIPPAHASTIVESIISAPLDLSSKMPCASSLKGSINSSYTPGYESYETLDLSNKKTDTSISDDIVVDLRVKPSQTKYQSLTLDLCAKLSGNRTGNTADIHLNVHENDSYQTDLSVQSLSVRKDLSFSHSSSNTSDIRPIVQDLSNSKSMFIESKRIYLSDCNTNTATIPEKATKSAKPKLAIEVKNCNKLSREQTDSSKCLTLGIPADLSRNVCARKQIEQVITTPNADQTCKAESKKACDMIAINTLQTHALEKSMQNQKPVYDPTLIIPQYKIRANTPATETVAGFTDDLVNVTETPICKAVFSQDTSFSKTYVGLHAVENVLGSSSKNTSIVTLPVGVSVQTNSGAAITSLNRIESTTPVYTLSNACITVTKIDSSSPPVLKNSLLSIPGTTIVNTTPVYTLTGTTIGTSTKLDAIDKESIHGSVSGKSYLTLPHSDDISKAETRINAPQTIGGIEKEGNKTEIIIEQDPETAKKIAMLPKELVEILGSMPIDHRNQLLNVLPQYVSTSVPHTIASNEIKSLDKNDSKNSTNKIPLPIEKNHSSIKSKAITSPTKSISTLPSLTLNQQPSILTTTPLKGQRAVDKHKILHNVKLPASLHVSTENSITIEEDTKASQTSKDVSNEEDKKKTTLNPISGKVYVTDIEENPVRVIDLTEDEVLPQLMIITDVPQTISISTQELSGGISGNIKKLQKRHNEKTASLRAVRIKAPAERQKENLILKRTSIEKVTQNTIKSDDNEARKLSKFNKSLAIQQAEISSTQHSSKVTNTDSKMIESVFANCSEDKIKPCRVSTPAADAVIEKHKTLQVASETSVLKSSIVTSTISVSKPEYKLARKEHAETGKKVSNTTNINTVEFASSIHYDDNNAPLTFHSDAKVKALKKMDNNLSVHYVEEKSNTQEEDSEDDIILAAIVKQKQGVKIKQIKRGTKQNKVSISRRKKKAKKIRKVSTERNTKEICVTYELSHKNQPIVQVSKIDKIPNDKDSVSNTQANNYFKEKSQKADTGINKKPDDYIVKKDKKKTIKEINKPVDQYCNNKNEDVERQNCNNTEILDRANKKKDDEIADNLKHKLQKNSSTPTVESKKHENATQNERSKETKKCSEPTITETRKQVKSNNQIKMYIELTRQNEIVALDSKVSDKNTISSNEVPNEELQLRDSINIEEVPRNHFELKKTNTEDSSNVHSNECHRTDSDSFASKYLDDNTSTPLRRSRRGKSLFIEGHPLAQETVNNDTTIDQKPLLTKKQLIFSKLLLDEEKHTKTISSKNCIGSTNTILNDDSDTNKNDVSSNLLSAPDKLLSSEVSTEKNKTTKRKSSPQSKRKYKKRKSIDVAHLSDDHTLTNDAEYDDNINLEQFEKISIPNKSVLSNEITLPTETESLDLPELRQRKSKDLVASTKGDGNKLVVKIDEAMSKSDIITSSQNKTNTKEKRKLPYTSSNAEFDQSTKSKKVKLNNSEEIHLLNKCDSKKSETYLSSKRQTEPSTSTDTHVTTCYNVPVAARKTRSKSVNVKLYDPYDIDLDEMIDTTEPLRKSASKPREIKGKEKNIVKLIHTKATKQYKSHVNIEMSQTDQLKQSSKRCKQELPSTARKINKILDEGKTKKKCVDDEIKHKKYIADITSEVQCNQSANMSETLSKEVILTTECTVQGNISDSDGSSTSDVPLNKYVECQTMKVPIAVITHDIETKDTKADQSGGKGKKQTSTECKKDDGSALPKETEEQIRSEQFMESFGFFSERKPRKSNLIATKKISETFHIIASESDDLYFGSKERTTKRTSHAERKKSTDVDHAQLLPTKKNSKRGRKKKECTKMITCYCDICKKEFRRPDNYVRHQMTLLHISKLSEVELKIKTIPMPEEPNYLIAYKQHLDRLKMLSKTLPKRKKNSRSKNALPNLEEILADVHKTVRQQQLSRRGLSRDEALFLDCCELLKESHRPDMHNSDVVLLSNNLNNLGCAAQSSNLDIIGKPIDKSDSKSDGDVDSITAKTILESEEVRNLENDLISGLKEAANSAAKNIEYQQKTCSITRNIHNVSSTKIFSNSECEIRCAQMKANEEFSVMIGPETHKIKKQPETKDKMYPDIEDIDMFEDKFDKIKRKCRSQAAAAKQVQTVSKPTSEHKERKKCDKKKGRKGSKKNYQNTVLTKGALKGFDGIKVSIPTSEINISSIVPPNDSAQKKKRKVVSKKKREKRDSETSSRYNSDNRFKEGAYSQKKVDVYEFMDNEDAELFEFRPSTLMERFKSISNKDAPSTSKRDSTVDELENSSESGSDGDDFVYMSDDYVCSEDETENSLLFCEQGNVKSDFKKTLPIKRKDVTEKNAVMGKIFKHNAVRAEKKIIKSKETETVKPKANLDQLFDSLLEDEPNPITLSNSSDSLQQEDSASQKVLEKSAPKHEPSKSSNHNSPNDRNDKKTISESTEMYNKSKKHEADYNLSLNKYEIPKRYSYGLSTSRKEMSSLDFYGPSTSKSYDLFLAIEDYSSLPKEYTPPKYCKSPLAQGEIPDFKEKIAQVKSPLNKLLEFECSTEDNNDTGVARQRARRKCTVGKQNVLAETWSSESEPDGLPPRSNSAESVAAGSGRKKKGKKKDSHQSFGRRGKVTFSKKQDIESRVNSNNRNTSIAGVSGHSAATTGVVSGVSERNYAESSFPEPHPPPTAAAVVAMAVAGPSEMHTSKVRPRAAAYYWSSEGDEEQEHQQQHGWIVGDSHKKLVTMLAHAKGRKRNNDEKRVIE